MDIVGLIAVSFSLLLPAAIIITAIVAQYKKKRKYYDSLLKALELGKNAEEIKEVFAMEKQKNGKNGIIGFLRGGIMVSGLGIGLVAIGLVAGNQWVYAASALILILGLSLIAVYYLTRPKDKTK